MKDIVYSRSAVRTLVRMPRNHANRIRNGVRAYARNPDSQANSVAHLRGTEGLLRLWISDWRIIMRDDYRLEILHVASRGSAHKE